MSFTAACYTAGCGWKKDNAKDATEAQQWGQWHALEMKWKTGRSHDTKFFKTAVRDSSARSPRSTE